MIVLYAYTNIFIQLYIHTLDHNFIYYYMDNSHQKIQFYPWNTALSCQSDSDDKENYSIIYSFDEIRISKMETERLQNLSV